MAKTKVPLKKENVKQPKPNEKAKPQTEQEARKALEALARKNTKSRSCVKRYPRYNGKVIELAPAPKFGKQFSRANRMRPHTPPVVPVLTAAEKRALDRAFEKTKLELIQRQKEAHEYQQRVARLNKRRLERETNPPKPMKLRVRVKEDKPEGPIKVIVLKGHSYRRPCGPIPAQFQGAHIVRSDSPMFSRKGSWPPPHYSDSTPLPTLGMGVWLSERANNDLARMLKVMTGLSQRCLVEINELSKSGQFKSAPFPEIRRRLVMSLIQELRETL